ncbi:hypothetical protein WR25_10180 [Diploscapter pachys]|uniref:Translocon-associated protein subunit gamma n=1 Tax=Diploscapter pachys TaxID=2018661 RepID=A0A2A2KM79_9BILA|nr:hypothetical protein WR25_10180 [Diploscapter pachys]
MGKFTKEEEVLLSSYSPANSAKSAALFYINAAVLSVAPLYLFYGVHQMEVADSWIVWSISALISSYLLSFACKNQKRLLKHQSVYFILEITKNNVLFCRIVMKRGPAVDREINQKYANDKKMSTKEKEVGQTL